ncbi:hypothetical protein Gogos_009914 [Gossypium gossypioides]|uniref:SAM-dependent methyltransferase Erg6/SMT-type domain-containing protein n=1 Tax=Gossypium gossypioides TaxID=34282 RepID=A0A7J9BJH6_GOSGO|nr:hypothetical protein [Gossypium gossypioides]
MRLFVCNTLSLNFSSKLLYSRPSPSPSPVRYFALVLLFDLFTPLSAFFSSRFPYLHPLFVAGAASDERERERERPRKMSKAGALDLASGLGGKIEKTEVLSAVEQYERYHVFYGGEEEERKANYTDMVNKYYDLVTSFYEFGWGESFHFAPRWKGESLKESIKRHEHFLALQLGLKPGHKVLDVGCGIGGPLREISRFSSTSVTGINNNEYQITRGKAEIEIGDGLPDIRLTGQCLEALKQAGFELIWEKDLAVGSPLPWYLPLDTSHFSLSSFRLTSVGRFITRNMVKGLEFVGLAPKGSQRVQDFLEKAAEGLVEGGRKEIFTPMYFFLARKPHSESQ